LAVSVLRGGWRVTERHCHIRHSSDIKWMTSFFMQAVGIVIGGRLGYTLFMDSIVLWATRCGCLGFGKVAWHFTVAS
jgi:prolipoprotein diacylglyceryltransferase